MEIIKNDGTMFKNLYESSALTLEGLAESSFGDFEEWLKSQGATEPVKLIVTSGKQMSDYYKLTGCNRYPDDLNIVSVDSSCLDLSNVIFSRFNIGARRFDDIVDNNLRRQVDQVEVR